MDAEKLKKARAGLEACSVGMYCGHECPYGEGDSCITEMARDALDVLEEMEKELTPMARVKMGMGVEQDGE